MREEIKQRIEQIRRGEVPEGYKKTKVGIVPCEWEEKRLSYYLKVNNDKNADLRYGKEDVFSISGELGIVNQIELLGRSYAGASVAPYGIVYPNNIVYTKSPLKANPYGIIKTNKTCKTGIVSTLYAVFHCKNNVSPDFVQSYFELDQNLNNYLYPIVNIGAKHDMKISDENSLSGYVVFPSLVEQQKIAEILSAQDKLIALKEKLIEEKKRQKKALMQQLLTGKKRLPGFSGEWKQVKLGDICCTFSGGTPNRSHSEYYGGDIPWIKSGELNHGDIYDTEETLTDLGLNNSSAKIAPKGTLLIAMYGATAGILAFTHIDAAINQAILALIPTTKVSTCFIKESLDVQIETATHRLTQGGQPNFNASIIESFSISMPCFEEQEAISNIAKTADHEIVLLNNDLYQDKQKKKALMQLLLTGIVRVNCNE